MPANGNAAERWRLAEEKQRNSEIMVWAILSGCSEAIATLESQTGSINGDKLINVVWPDPSAFGDLLHRIVGQADLTAFSDSILPASRPESSWDLFFPSSLMWKTATTSFAQTIVTGTDIKKILSHKTKPLLVDGIKNFSLKIQKRESQPETWKRVLEAFQKLYRAQVTTVIAPIMRCFAHLNAKGVDLSCQIICGIDLHNADLRDARFDNTMILYGDFRGAKLQKATFRNATLDSTLFRDADLTDTNWLQAKISKTELNGSVLTGASLEGAVMVKEDISIDDLRERGAVVTGIRTVRNEVRTVAETTTKTAPDDEASAP